MDRKKIGDIVLHEVLKNSLVASMSHGFLSL